MEAKGRKMLALGIVAMMCAVAIIGIGYAAFTGDAKTYNQGNSATAGYMTLTPQADQTVGAWDAITSNVANDFSTYTYDVSTVTTYAYYLDGATAITGNYVGAAIGSKSFVLDNKTGDTITDIKLTVMANKIVGNTDFVYIFGVTANGGTNSYYEVFDADDNDDQTEDTVTAKVIDNIAATFDQQGAATITVTLYIGYVVDGYIEPDYPIGAPAASATGTKTLGVNTSANAPVNFTGLALSFAVEDSS